MKSPFYIAASGWTQHIYVNSKLEFTCAAVSTKAEVEFFFRHLHYIPDQHNGIIFRECHLFVALRCDTSGPCDLYSIVTLSARQDMMAWNPILQIRDHRSTSPKHNEKQIKRPHYLFCGACQCIKNVKYYWLKLRIERSQPQNAIPFPYSALIVTTYTRYTTHYCETSAPLYELPSRGYWSSCVYDTDVLLTSADFMNVLVFLDFAYILVYFGCLSIS